MSHGVVGVNMVVTGVHLNTPPQNGCREMRRSVHEAVNIILQRFVLSIVEHRQSLNCCQILIPIILIDSRVLLKLLSFFIRKCVTHHSCQLVEYCFWNVFCQEICRVLQRIQLVQRDETDLVQLLNPHRLHLQVFRSAPWSKPLHNGFGAAAVRPEFNFERWCSLVFQQVFHVQRSNATLRDRLGL